MEDRTPSSSAESIGEREAPSDAALAQGLSEGEATSGASGAPAPGSGIVAGHPGSDPGLLDPDRIEAGLLRAAFFTGKGEPRSRLMVKKDRPITRPSLISSAPNRNG